MDYPDNDLPTIDRTDEISDGERIRDLQSQVMQLLLERNRLQQQAEALKGVAVAAQKVSSGLWVGVRREGDVVQDTVWMLDSDYDKVGLYNALQSLYEVVPDLRPSDMEAT